MKYTTRGAEGKGWIGRLLWVRSIYLLLQAQARPGPGPRPGQGRIKNTVISRPWPSSAAAAKSATETGFRADRTETSAAPSCICVCNYLTEHPTSTQTSLSVSRRPLTGHRRFVGLRHPRSLSCRCTPKPADGRSASGCRNTETRSHKQGSMSAKTSPLELFVHSI